VVEALTLNLLEMEDQVEAVKVDQVHHLLQQVQDQMGLLIPVVAVVVLQVILDHKQ
tara:strand:- start:60 stop:227 length:168 start_codon:yes stop_codon:yes gene_type:complete